VGSNPTRGTHYPEVDAGLGSVSVHFATWDSA